MKFICEKSLLVNAISIASRTVAQKSAISALEGIYVRAGMHLYLSGYNLETGITVTVPADITEVGECVMPAWLFFAIIRKMPDEYVTVSVDEKFKVSIKGGISSFSITCMSAEDYPELPDVEYENAIRIPQRELRDLISGTDRHSGGGIGMRVHYSMGNQRYLVALCCLDLHCNSLGNRCIGLLLSSCGLYLLGMPRSIQISLQGNVLGISYAQDAPPYLSEMRA